MQAVLPQACAMHQAAMTMPSDHSNGASSSHPHYEPARHDAEGPPPLVKAVQVLAANGFNIPGVWHSIGLQLTPENVTAADIYAAAKVAGAPPALVHHVGWMRSPVIASPSHTEGYAASGCFFNELPTLFSAMPQSDLHVLPAPDRFWTRLSWSRA